MFEGKILHPLLNCEVGMVKGNGGEKQLKSCISLLLLFFPSHFTT